LWHLSLTTDKVGQNDPNQNILAMPMSPHYIWMLQCEYISWYRV